MIADWGPYVDAKMQNLIKQLGETINSTISDSEPIAEVISRIKQEGYDVFLVLEATVGVNRREEEGEFEGDIERQPTPVGAAREPELTINAQDVRFLKSLRISTDEAA